jgi:murein DD-endopeptidase MepM/ murein hydrolase activator NlpD
MATVRVQGETYRSSKDLEGSISELQGVRENTPEYGPQRRSIDKHLEALQRELRTLKEQEAADQARETHRRDRKVASERSKEERASASRRAAAGTKRKRQTRSFLSSSRRDVSRASRSAGISQPVDSAGEIVLQVIGWTILTALGYALINPSGRGPATVAAAAKGSSGFLGRLLDPNQPLVKFGSSGSSSSGSSSSGSLSSASTSSAPKSSGSGSIIGRPYQGTHSTAYNIAGGSNNWESENAVDVAAPVGTPVYAVANGKIGSQIGSLGSGGRFAGLRLHLVSSTNEFYYAHLSKLAPGIKAGATVKQGQLLGYTGSANGVAHLHFSSKLGNPSTWAKSLGL